MPATVCILCGRSVERASGAGVCPSCGAPVAAPSPSTPTDADGATRPVDAALLAASPIAGDVTALAREPDPVTAPLPPVLAPDPATQRVEPPPAPPSRVAHPVPDDVVPARRSARGVISAVALLILLLAVATAGVLVASGTLRTPLGTQPAPTATRPAPTATPSLPAGFVAYSDPDQRFTLAKPTDWLVRTTTTTGQRLVILYDPQTGAQFWVDSIDGAGGGESVTLAQTLRQPAPASALTNRTPPRTVPVGTLTFTSAEADITLPTSDAAIPAHEAGYVTVVNGRTYALLTLAPAPFYPSMRQTFESMLNTFRVAG